MTLQDLFNMLAQGELTNLPMAASGSIDPGSYVKLTNYTNEALLKLYTRFVLKEDDLMLELYDHITNYHLIPRFAANYNAPSASQNEPIRYILDLPGEPFCDELIKVRRVFTIEGIELSLNDDAALFGVFTPRIKMLQVPNPVLGMVLNVVYQRKHPFLKGELSDEIECPDVLQDALTSFVAYKVFSHMNSTDSSAKSQEFMATYESICNEIVDRDLVNSSISQSNTRFSAGGWL